MSISQIIILITSGASLWLLTKTNSLKRWGFFVGLLGQPFWFYDTYKNQQWAFFALTMFYTYIFLKGIWDNFSLKIKKT